MSCSQISQVIYDLLLVEYDRFSRQLVLQFPDGGRFSSYFLCRPYTRIFQISFDSVMCRLYIINTKDHIWNLF